MVLCLIWFIAATLVVRGAGQEGQLQRGPFVRWNPRWKSYGGTRSQTIIVADRSCRTTWYCYRECDATLPGGGGCGLARDIRAGGTDHQLHVFGVPWPLESDGGRQPQRLGDGLRLPSVPTGRVVCAALAVVAGLAAARHWGWRARLPPQLALSR